MWTNELRAVIDEHAKTPCVPPSARISETYYVIVISFISKHKFSRQKTPLAPSVKNLIRAYEYPYIRCCHRVITSIASAVCAVSANLRALCRGLQRRRLANVEDIRACILVEPVDVARKKARSCGFNSFKRHHQSNAQPHIPIGTGLVCRSADYDNGLAVLTSALSIK